MNFTELKAIALKVAEEKVPTSVQTARLRKCNTIEELLEVAKDNISWIKDNLAWQELVKNYNNPEIFGSGKENVGLFNSGNYNSGYRNSGYCNSGYCNSGYYNSGDCNSGDRNSGDYNSGDCNSGDRNSGDCNSGYRNSGECNSGYRNSGVFCNCKNTGRTVIIFNRESNMTWPDWHNHPAYFASQRLRVAEWKNFSDMTEEEKKDNAKSYVTDGILITYTYHEAWENLWRTLTDEQKNSFKTLPNFDADVFEDITGIKI